MMLRKKYSVLLWLLLLIGPLSGQPGEVQQDRILIVGATAHLGTGTAIEDAAVGFSKGRIDYVGTANRVERADYDRVIDATGKHLYPGFIAANTTLGLAEISAARPTLDYAEVGPFNPNVRTIVAYDAESMITPTTVANGILIAQITPRSGVLSGTSSVVQLDAWNWEDAAIRLDDGVHLNWPQMTSKSGWYGDFGELKTNDKAAETIEQLRELFGDAQAYCVLRPDERSANLRLQALCGVLSGQQALYVHADRVQDIAAAIHFCKEIDVPRPVIVGGADAWMIPEMFLENDVALMLDRTHDLPNLPGDPVELPYALPRMMHEAGVPFCLQNNGRFERMQLRNLPFAVGTAVAHGLPYEPAVRAVTLNAAKILGIEKDYGSIEVGKSATLFISVGDALDVRTNRLTHAFIDGRSVRLLNRQEELYLRYRDKYTR